MFLNREGAKDAKVLSLRSLFFPDRNERSGKGPSPAGRSLFPLAQRRLRMRCLSGAISAKHHCVRTPKPEL